MMIKFDKKWTQIIAIGTALPSIILGSAWIMMKLIEEDVISRNVGIFAFLFIIFDSLFLLVWYAIKQKNK